MTPQDRPLTRLEEQLLRADIKANRPMSAWSVVRLLATLDEARSLPDEPRAPHRYGEWQLWQTIGREPPDWIDRDQLAADGVTTDAGAWIVSAAMDWDCDYGAFEVTSFVGTVAEIERQAAASSPVPEAAPGLRERLATALEAGWGSFTGLRDRTKWLAEADVLIQVAALDDATPPVPEAAPHRPDGAHWPSCRTCDEDWPCRAALDATPPALDGSDR
jgi:hypothetical protein